MITIFDDEMMAILKTLNAAGCGIDDNDAIDNAVRPFVPDLDVDGLTRHNIWQSGKASCDFIPVPETNMKLMCTVDNDITWTGGLMVEGELLTYCL